MLAVLQDMLLIQREQLALVAQQKLLHPLVR